MLNAAASLFVAPLPFCPLVYIQFPLLCCRKMFPSLASLFRLGLALPTPSPHPRSITSVFQPPAIQESCVFTLAGRAMRGKRFSCSSPDATNPSTPHSRLSPKWLEVEEIDWKPTRLPRDEFTSALWWLFSPLPTFSLCNNGAVYHLLRAALSYFLRLVATHTPPCH